MNTEFLIVLIVHIVGGSLPEVDILCGKADFLCQCRIFFGNVCLHIGYHLKCIVEVELYHQIGVHIVIDAASILIGTANNIYTEFIALCGNKTASVRHKFSRLEYHFCAEVVEEFLIAG